MVDLLSMFGYCCALGVAHTLKILKEELEVSMIFTGCKDIQSIDETILVQ
ncbi:alpha-hydroxy-acid oxidizing protein [Aliarcobacter butzleri]